MKQHLKDCPMCGARPDIFQDAKGKWDVMCPNCDHHGALTAICDKDTAQDAVDDWNKQTVEDIENEFPELKRARENFEKSKGKEVKLRVIGFRGKTSKGRWLYGDFRHGFNDESPSGYITQDHQYVMVKKETVGQYVGLTANDGTKIYEGDVLHVIPCWGCNEYEGVVKFNEKTASFEVFCIHDDYTGTLILKDDFSIEILGNIYDKPEFSNYKELYFQEV